MLFTGPHNALCLWRCTVNNQCRVERRYAIKSVMGDIKSLKDNVKLVADQVNDTQEPFRHKMNSFVRVCAQAKAIFCKRTYFVDLRLLKNTFGVSCKSIKQDFALRL